MMDILLFVHIVNALLLVVVILLQKTGSDGVSGLSGGNNMGLVTGRSAANFLTKTTIVLIAFFMISSLVLANLSSRKTDTIDKKIESAIEKESSVPVAK